MSPSIVPRRSRRLHHDEAASEISDFDYPGPKQSSLRSGKVRKVPRRNRRIREEVVIINDDEPEPTPSPSMRNTPATRKMKSKSSPDKSATKAKSNRIMIGRVTKPIPCRRQPLNKNNSAAPATHIEIPNAKPFALPTSPLSTQDTHDLASERCDSVPVTSPHLSLGYEPEGPVLGREEESNRLSQSLLKALRSDQPSTGIYVCGTPGTGKTYTVSKVAKRIRSALSKSGTETISETQIAEEEEAHLRTGSTPFKEVWVNCANLPQAKDLFSYLAGQISCCSPQQNPRDVIRQYASSSGPKTLVVLDEVDFLTSKDQMVLYSAFEWPRISNSRIVVVGIANSIDLPVRLLPWLRQAGCMPEIVSFTPYSAKALERIVQQRIDNIESTGLTPVAISLAAKKVAAGCGDARLMLDVCREAQSEMKGEAQDRSCIAVVASIISQRGGLSAAVETIRQLPVQQQIALCVAANAVLFSKRKSANGGKQDKKATLGGLYDSFVRMCQRTHVSVLSFPEFADICCNSLMHHGLVDVSSTGRGKSVRTLRGRPIRLRVPIEDVRAGVADKGFLPMLLAE